MNNNTLFLNQYVKNTLLLFAFSIMTACTQVKVNNSYIYQCIEDDAKYVERCKLKNAKEQYEEKEIAYYFEQVGKRKFEKEIKDYTNAYIRNAELYCGMNTSFSFVDIPKEKSSIYEKTAECLVGQYAQLGKNLRAITDRAIKTIIERVNQ